MGKKSKLEQHPDKKVSQQPNVVVKFRNEVDLPYIDKLENYIVENELAPWKELISRFPGISIQRIYVTLASDHIQKLEDRAFENVPVFERPNLLKFFRIVSPPDTDRNALANNIAEWKITELAYVPFGLDSLTDPPSSQAVLQATLFHLDQAPGSIGVEEAWLTLGADGRDMQFIDLERGWVINHENFINPASTFSVFSVADPATSQTLSPTDPNYNYYMGHGTSVLGTVAAPDFSGLTIGMAFRATGRVISIDRIPLGGDESIHDAITVAVSMLNEGDVLLIEAQAIEERIIDDEQKIFYWPVEVNWLEYNEILTATGNNIIVIEPAGNGIEDSAINSDGNNLDLYKIPGTTTHILDRGTLRTPPEFRDSKAIMVGSAGHTYPHSRMLRTANNSESNFGSRVDCYAWGEEIKTTGGPAINDYDYSFGSTSGASAMIAGAALIVQGLAKANDLGDNSNGTFKPTSMRALLTNPLYSTPSANPSSDLIGRMPDLVKIIDKYMGLGPDLLLRDFLGDTGDPHTDFISASPDIIVRNTQEASYESIYGQGSPNQNLNGLGETILKDGNNKYIYVRVTNRGATIAQNVQVTVYWSEVVTLLTPGMWHEIGSINLATSIPPGEMKVCEVIWQEIPTNPIPPPGHYCFVGLVENPRDHAPTNLTTMAFATWDEYYNFIRQFNNVTWCNFNVKEMSSKKKSSSAEGGPGESDLAGGGAEGNSENGDLIFLPFFATGGQFEDLPMQLEIVAQLPNQAQLWLEGSESFLTALNEGRDVDLEDTKKKALKRIRVNSRGHDLFRNIIFPGNMRERMRLIVNIPAELRQQPYEIYLRQLHKDKEIGRITWRLVSPLKKGLSNWLDDIRKFFASLSALNCLLFLLLGLALLIILLLVLIR